MCSRARWFTCVFVFVIAMVLSGYVRAQMQPGGAPLTAVSVVEVKKAKVAQQVERVGRIRSVDDIELRARVQGFLVAREFAEGADVKAGDLLFVIEKEPYEIEVERTKAELARAMAQLENTQRDLGRAQVLRRQGNVSQSTLDDALAEKQQAEADVQARKAALRAAELNLSYTEIRAPVDGRIGLAQYSVGDLVGPDSDVLATIVTLDPIEVYVEVPETVLFNARRRDEARRQQGQPPVQVTPRIRLRDGAQYGYGGKVDFRDNQINPTTGTQTARAVFPNPEKLLLPGQYVTVFVQIGEEQDKLLIPQVAVQEDQAGYFVLVVNDADEVEIRRVDVGDRQGIFFVVENGLAEGERVIFQGVQKVRPGMKVVPTLTDPDDGIASPQSR